jgi:hypothetical protein
MSCARADFPMPVWCRGSCLLNVGTGGRCIPRSYRGCRPRARGATARGERHRVRTSRRPGNTSTSLRRARTSARSGDRTNGSGRWHGAWESCHNSRRDRTPGRRVGEPNRGARPPGSLHSRSTTGLPLRSGPNGCNVWPSLRQLRRTERLPGRQGRSATRWKGGPARARP